MTFHPAFGGTREWGGKAGWNLRTGHQHDVFAFVEVGPRATLTFVELDFDLVLIGFQFVSISAQIVKLPLYIRMTTLTNDNSFPKAGWKCGNSNDLNIRVNKIK